MNQTPRGSLGKPLLKPFSVTAAVPPRFPIYPPREQSALADDFDVEPEVGHAPAGKIEEQPQIPPVCDDVESARVHSRRGKWEGAEEWFQWTAGEGFKDCG